MINWKRTAAAAAAAAAVEPVTEPAPLAEPLEQPQVLADEASDLPADEQPHPAWDDGPLADPDDILPMPEIRLDADAGLADWLCAARETAEAVKSADHRSRSALYRALGQAYDFALAARQAPDDYAELLEESGVKAQARAPMTPIVKLVFGIDYDKTRLTEFAAALSFGQRQSVEQGEFAAFVERQAGGLKALVAAEREARRPAPRPDTRAEQARERLRGAAPLEFAALPAESEFCLVLTRRGSHGEHEAVALVADPGLLDRAIRRAA